MERTFFPLRRFWVALLGPLSLGVVTLGLFIVAGRVRDSQTGQTLPQEHPLFYFSVLSLIASLAVYPLVETALANYRRMRLVIREDEVCYHGAWFTCVIRFAEVIEVRWVRLNESLNHLHRLRLRTAKNKLVIRFDAFVSSEAQGELIDLIRSRLGPHVRQYRVTLFRRFQEEPASDCMPEERPPELAGAAEMHLPKERTFLAGRSYWRAYGGCVSGWSALIGGCIFLTQLEGEPVRFRWHTSTALWCSLAACVLYLTGAAVYGVLAYRRKRLVIREDRVCSYGPLSVRTIRFADVIMAYWLHSILNDRIRGVVLRTAKRRLEIAFDHFVPWQTQHELMDFFRYRLGANVWRNWDRETLLAVREGRASYWGPPVFTIKKMARMLAATTGLAGIVGVAIGSLLQRPLGIAELWADAANRGQLGTFLQIRIPSAAERLWSGSLLIDWGVGSGILGLSAGILFLSGFWFLEWTGRKWRTIQGRRFERAGILPSPESGGGRNAPVA